MVKISVIVCRLINARVLRCDRSNFLVFRMITTATYRYDKQITSDFFCSSRSIQADDESHCFVFFFLINDPHQR